MIVDLDEAALRNRHSLKWQIAAADVLPAWVAEMDFALDPVIDEAVRAAVCRGEVAYATPADSRLAAATHEFLRRRFDWDVDPGRIVGTGDVLSGIGLTLTTFCEDAPVVVPTPTYPPFFEVVPLACRKIVPIELNADSLTAGLDVERIDHALAAGARTVLLCHPHNPWGRDFTVAELTDLRDVVDRHGARVVSDEVHAPLVLGPTQHVPYASIDGAAEHTTTIVSASKAWNVPGLKCAQIVAATVEEGHVLRGVPLPANAGMSPLGVAANVAAYTGDDRWLDAVRHRIRDNRDAFAERLGDVAPHARMRPLEATYLAWVDARAYGLANPARTALERGRVLVNDGATFGPGGDGHVRVNLATSTQRVRGIAERLAYAWEGAAE